MELLREYSSPRLIFTAKEVDIFNIKNAVICVEGNRAIDFSDAVTVDSTLRKLHASCYVFNKLNDNGLNLKKYTYSSMQNIL